MKPAKVVIEITAEGYSHKIFDEAGEEMWGDKHIMESAGYSRAESSDGIFDHPIADKYETLAEAVDDFSFGPFGVAQALWKIVHDEGCEDEDDD